MAGKDDGVKCYKRDTVRRAKQVKDLNSHDIETTSPLQVGDWLLLDDAGNITAVMSDADFRSAYEVLA